MKITVVFVLLISSNLANGAVEGQEVFDKAYKEYWSKPIKDWNKVVGSKQTETYVIQKKDTLSELSEVFFGTPNYWPKIWSLNEYIGNPHLIYPGNKLGFFVGSADGQAPGVFLSIDEGNKPKTSTYALDVSDVQLPPEPKDKPVVNNLPRSFSNWPAIALKNNPEIMDSNEVEKQFSKIETHVMKFGLTSFMNQGEINAIGKINGFLNVDSNSAFIFDEVYIDKLGDLSVGQVYSLVVPKDNARFPSGGSLVGVNIYEFVGEIKITSENKNESGLISGTITKAIDIIEKGALLVPGRIPQYDLKFNPNEIKQIDAQVLRGSKTYGHNILGVGQTVYLSQGENQGIASGTLVQIKQNRKERNSNQDELGIVNQIGVIKVVLTSSDVSTGIVVSSRDFLLPGDNTIVK